MDIRSAHLTPVTPLRGRKWAGRRKKGSEENAPIEGILQEIGDCFAEVFLRIKIAIPSLGDKKQFSKEKKKYGSGGQKKKEEKKMQNS